MKNKNKNIKFFALVVSLFGYGYNANAWDYGKHFYSRMNIYTGLSIGLQKGTWAVNNKLTFGDFLTNGAVDSWTSRDYRTDGNPIAYREPILQDEKYKNVENAYSTLLKWKKVEMQTIREAGYIDGDGNLLYQADTELASYGSSAYAYQNEDGSVSLREESTFGGTFGTAVSWSPAETNTVREAGYIDGDGNLLYQADTELASYGSSAYAYQNEDGSITLNEESVINQQIGIAVSWENKIEEVKNPAGYYVYNYGEYGELKQATETQTFGTFAHEHEDGKINAKSYYNSFGTTDDEKYTNNRYHEKDSTNGNETGKNTNDIYNSEWYDKDHEKWSSDTQKIKDSYRKVYEDKIDEMGKNREIFQNIVLEDRRVAMVFGGGYNFYWRVSKKFHPFIGVDFSYYLKMFSTFERGAGAYQQEFFNIKYKEIIDFHAKIGAKFLINENVALQTYGLIGFIMSDLDVTYKDNLFTSDLSVSGTDISGYPPEYTSGSWNFSHEGRQKNMGFGNPAKQRLYGLSYGTGFEAIIKDTFILGVEYRCHRTTTSQVRLSNDFSLNSKFDISVHHVIFKFGFQFW